jgi:malonate-semialdehyde dehydrogenase (acetylating)/methylmalonate-semialdehyde dehydrogenase
VAVGIPPFNFPALIPLWMMSVAVACGNTFVLKPAEKAPLTGTLLVDMFTEAGLPPGVVSVVQGSKDVSERLIANPHVQAVSFVGTSAAAESVYRLAAAHGKRVQAHGGAKNHLIILPDADLQRSLPALIGSCFGSAGQRCLAGSVLVVVGDRGRQDAVVDAFIRMAGELKLGDGLDDAATLCPVVNPKEEQRIRAAIECGGPFGGWKNSMYGDVYAQADAVAFYTRKKIITEHWFGAEAPKDGWA